MSGRGRPKSSKEDETLRRAGMMLVLGLVIPAALLAAVPVVSAGEQVKMFIQGK
jgi:hypothetical protein